MSGWSVLAIAAIGFVVYYFSHRASSNKSGHSTDGGTDTGGDLKMSDFSWAPGHHHADSGGIGSHHGGASGDFSAGSDSGGGSGDSGSF